MKLALPEQKKLELLEQLATDEAIVTLEALNEGEFCLEFDNNLIFESESSSIEINRGVETLIGSKVTAFAKDIAPLGPKRHPGYYDLTFSNGLTLRGNVWDTGIQLKSNSTGDTNDT